MQISRLQLNNTLSRGCSCDLFEKFWSISFSGNLSKQLTISAKKDSSQISDRVLNTSLMNPLFLFLTLNTFLTLQFLRDSATRYPLESQKAPLAISIMLSNNWTSLTALTEQQLPHFLLSPDDYLHAKNKICQLLQHTFELGKNCLGKDQEDSSIMYPSGIKLLNVNKKNTRRSCEKCSKLTIKTKERRKWLRACVFIINFEHISQHALVVFFFVNFEQVNAAG